MSIPVLIDLSVGEIASTPEPAAARTVSLPGAEAVALAAQESGVTALRLVEGSPGARTLDPSVVAGYLAGRYPQLSYLVDVPTTHNAPYNTARRVLSLDRATSGRLGLVLRPGGGDEVSDATVPDPTATDSSLRWTEYARTLTLLWESFPREALVGDQERAVVADDALIRQIDHTGSFYRVAGPLDGPSSVQGRPVLVAADLGVLDWAAIAASADVVVVSPDQAPDAGSALTAALEQAGRARADVALVGRTSIAPGSNRSQAAEQLRAWVRFAGLDGLELVPAGGSEEIAELIRGLVPLLAPAHVRTLRESLGLSDPAPVSV